MAGSKFSKRSPSEESIAAILYEYLIRLRLSMSVSIKLNWSADNTSKSLKNGSESLALLNSKVALITYKSLLFLKACVYCDNWIDRPLISE